MKQIIKDEIFAIVEVKRAENKDPLHCLYSELQSEIVKRLKSELNQLFRDGEIEVGETINDKWIKLK